MCWLIAIGSVAATLLVVLVIRNLSSLERQLEHIIDPDFHVEDPAFQRTVSFLLGPGLLDGNRVEALVNGSTFFPRMLEDIRSAEHSIAVETFIYWSGDMGKRFAEALVERAQAGVRVHVLVDWLGSWKMEKPLLSLLQSPDNRVEFRFYRPPNLHNLATFNNRTHRKLLVVDGRIGYAGGAGIADEWEGNAEDPHHWRDTMYRVEGPVVGQLLAAFMDNWVQVSQNVLLGAAYLPESHRAGNIRAQAFKSGPFEGSESARLMYLLSMGAARRRICLAQAYFIPDSLCRKSLIDARRRGVRVEVIIARHTDARWARRCTWALIGELLRNGIEIYEYQPAMYHCKLLIVDETWVSAGSTNFDTRSFRLNDEVNLNVYDNAFACSQQEMFEEDKRSSRRITLEEWEKRPLPQRLLGRVAEMLRPQL